MSNKINKFKTVIRGGSWVDYACFVWVAYREEVARLPLNSWNNLGFRVFQEYN